MGRRRYRDFSGGLFPSGPRESIPSNALRRARGLWPVRTAHLRSRNGIKLLETVPLGLVDSIVRFSGLRYYGGGGSLYRSDGSGAPVLVAGLPALNGGRLRFLKMPPNVGMRDVLYCCGGGSLFKVQDGLGGAVAKWGIAAPPDAHVTAALAAQSTKTIDNCDSNANWGVGDAVANEATIKVQGTNSLRSNAGIGAGATGHYVNTSYNLNLNEFNNGADDSPDEDWISLAIRLDHPRQVDSISMTFGKDANFNAGFAFEIQIDDDARITKTRGRKKRGLADHPVVSNNEAQFKASTPSLPLKINASILLGDDRASAADNVWARLLIPKIAFTPVGDATTWAAITALKFDVKTNNLGSGTVTFYFDDIKLVGGVGMQGDYQALFTYASNPNVQGYSIRSNPNATALVIKDVKRQGIDLTIDAQMVSTDPQVAFIEEWRTLGNGEIFFLAKQFPNAAATVHDTIADYSGLHSTTTNILSDETLPLDNIVPASTFVDVVGPHYGRCFWLDRTTNHVYYSAPGRPESVAGFVAATGTDDPGQRLVLWNDAVWLQTTRHIFMIAGTTEPFVPIQVPGGLGTNWPDSVMATELGIFFRAVDGPRLFDGVRTIRLREETFGQLYEGEFAENLAPLAADTAGTATHSIWTGKEWILTDGLQTWAYSIAQQQWVRDFGQGFSQFFFEKETGYVLVSSGGKIGILDSPGTRNDFGGTPISFDVSLPGLIYRSAEQGLVQRAYVEINTGGQIITPILIVNENETQLPEIVTLTKQPVELPIALAGSVFGLRLTGALTTAPVEISAIEWDGPDVQAEQET